MVAGKLEILVTCLLEVCLCVIDDVGDIFHLVVPASSSVTHSTCVSPSVLTAYDADVTLTPEGVIQGRRSISRLQH